MTALPGTKWEDWEEQLTVPRLTALRKEWERNPPVHFLVASFVGYKKPAEEEDQKLEDLFQLFPDGTIK